MSTRTLLSRALFVLLPLAAYGQATRTWISGVGDDVNPCSRTAPCKTFAGAISKTATGGEINVLDPGGFGGLTITKSIIIDGGFNIAGVLVSGTNGLTVSAPGATVTIRNLDIDGLGTGLSGISLISAATLHIENSRIYGFTQPGIALAGATATTTNVIIKNTVVRDCVGSTTVGVQADSTAGLVVVDADHLSVHDCPVGLSSINGSQITVHNPDFSSNPTGASAGAGSIVNLDFGVISHCTTTAVSSTGAGAIVRLSNISILDNQGQGLTASGGGAIISFVNNRINGNHPDGTPTQSIYQK